MRLLGEFGEDARPLAGGHSLLPMMKLRLAAPSCLVDLAALDELRGIRVDDKIVRIGAMVTQSEIVASADLREAVPILAETALQIADPQVRSLGTIGGNVANGDPGNDMPAVMQCLDATFLLTRPSGERRVSAREFYKAAYVTALVSGEILTAIEIPRPPRGHGFAYEKLKRKVGDYAIAAAACVLTVEGGRIASCAIALTNLGETPILAAEAAAILVGHRPDAARLEAAVAAAKAMMQPASDARGPAEYRIAVGGVMVRRAVERAFARAGGTAVQEGNGMSKVPITVTVNGQKQTREVEPRLLLVHFLREELGLTGTHIGCETSHCGACTVELDGRSVKSCTVLAVQADGREVMTIEGMAADGTLHPLQQAFWQEHALQCGYCTPGMIMRAYRLLQENPDPDEDEVRAGIAGNLCRCTGYQNIVAAILRAARELREGRAGGMI